ncbi:heparinase II/III-family protein [Paenibacillus cremeus]|uniref:heparinase II/III-family protein n=1 Tax=Paenibacillus cremeus TaxID=2163881 RepID=UPI0021BDAF4E|nr:heparinase II/III-family protein [Paenibacillus cremeus]
MISCTFHELRKAVFAVQKKPKSTTLLGASLDKEALRARLSQPCLEAYIAEVREEAVRAKTEPVPQLPFELFHLFSTTGTRKEYETPYFERRGRLLALALATLADETQEFVVTLENLIWDICGEYSWSLPAHLPSTMESVRSARVAPEHTVDLFAAETAHALAETLYLVGERLHPWVELRIREEVERRIFKPIFDTPYHFGWESQTHNWSAVCAGSVGMAAMLLVEDAERLSGMLDRLLRAMGCFLQGYGEDGCCSEGIGYWNYGFGYYVYFSEMLYELTEGAIDLLQGEKLRAIASFPSAAALTAPVYVNFSDSSQRHEPYPGLHSRLHHRIGQQLPEMTRVPSLHADHCYRFAANVRSLLWTDPALLRKPAAVGTFYFPETDWIVDKQLAAGGMLAFAAKGGHNAEPHNHNDLGHFILHIAGDSLLADLGAGVYTKGYFGAQRYTYLHNASEGHSVPIVGGLPQAAGRQHAARLLRREQSEGTLHYELELAGAYPAEAGLRSLIRAFEWKVEQAGAVLSLTDAVTFADGGRAIEEVFISYHEPKLGAPGQVLWQGARGEVTLSYEASEFDAAIEAIPTHKHSSMPVTVYRVRLQQKASAPAPEVVCRFQFACRLTN